jgi:adenosine/AMP kinase
MSLSASLPFKYGPVSTGRAYAYRTGMGIMPSAEFIVTHDDFTDVFTTNVPTGWKAAIIDTGATLVASTVASTGACGVALIASDGASEGVAIYKDKAVQLTAGKKFVIEVRVQTNLVAETEVQFGLTDLTATTNPEDLWTTTAANLVAFGTLPGSATTKMLSDKSNSGTSVQTGTRSLTNATWHWLAIAYDGANLRGYVDGKESLTWSSASTTIPTGVALTPFIGGRTGATASNTISFDTIRILIER